MNYQVLSYNKEFLFCDQKERNLSVLYWDAFSEEDDDNGAFAADFNQNLLKEDKAQWSSWGFDVEHYQGQDVYRAFSRAKINKKEYQIMIIRGHGNGLEVGSLCVDFFEKKMFIESIEQPEKVSEIVERKEVIKDSSFKNMSFLVVADLIKQCIADEGFLIFHSCYAAYKGSEMKGKKNIAEVFSKTLTEKNITVFAADGSMYCTPIVELDEEKKKVVSVQYYYRKEIALAKVYKNGLSI